MLVTHRLIDHPREGIVAGAGADERVARVSAVDNVRVVRNAVAEEVPGGGVGVGGGVGGGVGPWGVGGGGAGVVRWGV